MLNAPVIAEYLKKRHRDSPSEVAAYWLEESASRSELVSLLSSSFAGLPILVATVPKNAFDDPNGVIDDLAMLISANSAWFTEANRAAVIRDQKFSLVLVSKRPLGVPQISSPVTLPEWFPLWPNRLLTITIQSISELVDISISSPDIPVALINASLHQLEAAICRRLLSVHTSTPAATAKLRGRFSGSVAADLSAIILQSQAGLAAGSPDDFRPGGAATSSYVVSHLFRQWWACSHEKLHDLSSDVAQALGLDSKDAIEAQFSLASVLTRTVKPKLADTPVGVTFSRNALLSLAHSIQFTNATHHGGDYPNLPAVLTMSYAQDLARSCRRAADALDSVK